VILLRGFVDIDRGCCIVETASVTTCPECRQQERRTQESPDVLSPKNGAQATDTQHKINREVSRNEYFFAALLTSTDAKTLPVMVASQTGSQGINWWSMAALSTAAIAPLVIIGILLDRYIVGGLTTGTGK